VTNATDKEFVGIRLSCDEDFNYYMDQSRMTIVQEANMTGAPDGKLPYPLDGPALSKQDCATEDNAACVACASTPHITRNMRHIKLTHHFLEKKTTDGTCIVTKVRTEDNNSDIGTKRVPLPLFISLTVGLTSF
jgi:hypothetical protein